MVRKKLCWTVFAKTELRKIFDYYKEEAGVRIAHQIRRSILHAPKILETFPEAGRMEENLRSINQGHRFLVDGNYKIIYLIEQKFVYVTDVFDMHRDPQGMEGRQDDQTLG